MGIIRLARLLALALSTTPSLAAGQHAPLPRPLAGEEASRSLEALHARIDSIRRDHDVPAAQVALIRPDKTVFWNFGIVRPGAPVTDATMFRVGSVSKTFAGLAMLMLVERGLVSLDDPLEELAPELPIRNPWRTKHPVRLSHLLEAGAGFVGFQTPHEQEQDKEELELQDFLSALPFRLDVQWRPGGDQGGPRAGRPDDALVAFMTTDDGTVVMQHLDHPWESFERVPCP